jgi:hypothetical protein
VDNLNRKGAYTIMEEKLNYAEAFEMFAFNEDATRCMCKGGGYALSDRDSWHRCPYHATKDTPHPEDECYGPSCTECWDGENYPCDKCPQCGMHMQSQGWNDEPQSHELVDEPSDTEPKEDDCPF